MEGRHHLSSRGKAEIYFRRIIRSLWSCNYVDWMFLVSDRASGGVLVMWDSRAVVKLEEFVREFSMACSLKSVEDNFLWTFTKVYEPNLDSDRILLWDELVGLHN